MVKTNVSASARARSRSCVSSVLLPIYMYVRRSTLLVVAIAWFGWVGARLIDCSYASQIGFGLGFGLGLRTLKNFK